MSIGERRFRVTFERRSTNTNDLGETTASWETICTSWALVQPLRGRERFGANQVQADVDHRIVTRGRAELEDLTAGDRVTWRSHVYDIRSVIWRDHRRHELELLAQEHH